MEKIELRVEKLAGADVGRQWFAVFGIAGGTIGRGGQNKLVLPDTDAGVARVHAMVRLESDAAYIANLCERRSMHVGGMEVLSGQEVQLQIGAEVQIGPYSLRAVPPGTPMNKVVESVAPQMPVTVPAALVAPEPVRMPSSALASTPNPWADIPHQTWGEGVAVAAPLPKSAPLDTSGSSLGDLLGTAAASAKPPEADNPFAMLGRVESNPKSAQRVETKSSAPDVEWVAGGSVKVESTAAQPAAQPSLPTASPAMNPLLIPEARLAPEPTPTLPNVFDGLGLPARPAAAPPVNRPLVIPADFDPFARDLKKETDSRDPWAGGLPAQSLSQVANIQSDELIRSLPLKGRIDQALDNPAHSGLPKALDPKSETDPMRLFQGQGVIDGLVIADTEVGRGSELVQVFNLPKGVERSAPVIKTVPQPDGLDASPNLSPAAAVAVAAQPAGVPTVQALGLLPTQGLDLGMFGGADVLGGAATPVAPAAPALAVSTPALAKRADATAVRDAVVPAKVAGPTIAVVPTAAPPVVGTSKTQAAQTPESRPLEPAAAVAASGVTVDLNLNEAASVVVAEAAKPTPPASTGIPDAQALMNAFMAGAGLAPGRVEAAMTPEFMHQFGEAFRVAVQGTIELLAARSEIKREFRADVTIIAPRANNPLKFLPNADGVIMQMLGQSFPGFMRPVPSMKEAYFDLQVHQLALMAGIRAAYAEALARFDPAELEKRCDANGGLLSKISTTARKAAVWDDYKQSYNAIRRHAEDDLVAFSGEAFVKAYDAAAEAAREYP
jgi:FHA domain-containing protein